jgi:VWFA-related protein
MKAPVSALLATSLLVWAPAVVGQTADEDRQPLDPGIVERSGITLMLLDVEVTDREGNPIPGLREEDFIVQLDGHVQEIYSLDDLCRAAPDERLVAELESGGEGSPTGSEIASAVPAERPRVGPPEAERARFALYLDFSQLGPFGRANAVEEARRWIRETMQPDDVVQIAAYASLPGMKRLTPFTSDKQALLAAIDTAEGDPQWIDPFPGFLELRIQECALCCRRVANECDCYDPKHRQCCPVCRFNARDEYYHGKHSLEALGAYLRGLEDVPGRKAVILFQKTGVIYPSRFYPPKEAPQFSIGDQVTMLDRTGAEATLSRAAIHTAYAGDSLSPDAVAFVNLGANLAEFTGGTYGRGALDLSRVTAEAGRRTTCVYRLGLRQPANAARGISRVRVTVRDRALPYRYRVQFLDEVDRWWRSAQSVLADPDNYVAVDVGAAVLPLSASSRGWDLAVQVALDVDSLMLFPTAGKQQGDWEVGALLARNDGSRSWEMSKGRPPPAPSSFTSVVSRGSNREPIVWAPSSGTARRTSSGERRPRSRCPERAGRRSSDPS